MTLYKGMVIKKEKRGLILNSMIKTSIRIRNVLRKNLTSYLRWWSFFFLLVSSRVTSS